MRLAHKIQSCELETTHEFRQQGRLLVYLASLLAVREVAVSGEPTGSEGFSWIWVLWALKRAKSKVQHIIRASTLPVVTFYMLASCEHGKDRTWMPGGML